MNRPLFAVPVAWIAAPGLVPDAEPLSLGALMRHPLVTYPRNTSPYVELRDLVLKANLLPSQIHTSASLATIVKMGVERLGICVIPPAIVRNELASGALRILPTEQALSDLTFTATHAKRPRGISWPTPPASRRRSRGIGPPPDKAGLSPAIRNDDWRAKRQGGIVSHKAANRPPDRET